MYGSQIRLAFAQTYARVGNATHSLKAVLGEERVNRMQPHTLRAKASTLLNDYRTVGYIEQCKAEMIANGIPLPHYRERTERTDLFKDPPIKLDFLSGKNNERAPHKTLRAEVFNPYSLIEQIREKLNCQLGGK